MKLVWLFSPLLLAACGNQDPPACPAIDASTCQTPIASYSGDVAPLLDRACNSSCHATGLGPWPLNSWADVSDWAPIIAGDLETCTMPPADASAGSGNLTDHERALILNWLACGAPNN
jgi:hypothetical protein